MCEVSAVGKISDCQPGGPGFRVEFWATFFSVRGQGSKPLVWSLYVLSGAGDLKEPTHLLIEVCLSAGVVVADEGH